MHSHRLQAMAILAAKVECLVAVFYGVSYILKQIFLCGEYTLCYYLVVRPLSSVETDFMSVASVGSYRHGLS